MNSQIKEIQEPLLYDQKRLKELLKDIPSKPGCYLMLDKSERILYVGKSKNILTRVRSYFRDKNEHTPRISLMVRQIYDIHFIVTDNESEAFTLEDNLIKSNQPYYNILLKDDKKYPYICITWSDKYPLIYLTRKRRNRKNEDKYYGPYVDVSLLRNTLYLIKQVFPLRQRATALYKDRTCLNYSIKKCPGVCQEMITSEEYRNTLKRVEMIFQGRSEELMKLLNERMTFYSENMNYEKAIQIREQIRGLRQINEAQKMSVTDSSISRDIISLSSSEEISSVQLFQMRAGKLVSRLGYMSTSINQSKEEQLQIIMEEHYGKLDPVEIPKDIITGYRLPQENIISSWLSEIKGSKVHIYNPQKGKKLSLIKLVEKNAEYELKKIRSTKLKLSNTLEELTELLNLNFLPRRIEGYDISHLSGSLAVGSQVVFMDGIPAKQHYRKYKIKNNTIRTGYNNDYASLSEVIYRRFLKWSKLKKETGNINRFLNNERTLLNNNGFTDWPDLVLIDGGKGQLSSVLNVLKELNLDQEVNICSLAKKREEVFLPNGKEPIDSSPDDPAITLLRRIRDEAHRFAISFQKQRRTKYMTKSTLLNIPGLGPKRIKELLLYFKSIEAIKLASIEELNKVPGFGKSISTLIWKYLNTNG